MQCGIYTFSLLKRLTYVLKFSLGLCIIVYRSSDCFSSLRLLANCSINVFGSYAKELIELLGKFVYHCKVGPLRLDPKALHMHASLRSRGIAAVNILCLYCAIWSSGSIVPSYCFLFGKLNFLGISVSAIASTNGESVKLLAVLFFIGVGTPEILWRRASIYANLRENSKLADKCCKVPIC